MRGSKRRLLRPAVPNGRPVDLKLSDERKGSTMTRRFSRRAGLVAVLAVGALIAVAAASAGPKAGTPIKLMVIAPVATPIQNYPDAQAGAQAAAAAINKAGGIKGRQIELTFCNRQP